MTYLSLVDVSYKQESTSTRKGHLYIYMFQTVKKKNADCLNYSLKKKESNITMLNVIRD